MTDFAELERAKRRRLQEAYADLRPATKQADERQAKLRSLLLGAAADASLPASLGPGSPAGFNARSARALAAEAAASIASVGSTPGGRTGPLSPRLTALHSPAGASTAYPLSTSSPISPISPISPDQPTARGSGWQQQQLHPHHRGRGGGTPQQGGRKAAPPPPGPMEGGFLQETDPVQRLSRVTGFFSPGGGRGGCGAGGVGNGHWAFGSPGSLQGGAAAPTAVGGGGTAAGGGASPAGSGQSPGVYPWQQPAGAPQSGEEEEVEVPSDVELALMALKSDLRAHPSCSDLPPLALRSQLSCLLTDRSTVERQLDEQRRANRVRLFKLPTGPDEFGVLTTSDYRAIVRQAADAAAGSTSAPAVFEDSTGAYGGTSGGGGASSHNRGGAVANLPSRWHKVTEKYLRQVVDRFTEFQLSHQHLVHLLSTPVAAGSRPAGHRNPPPPGQSWGPAGTGARAAGRGNAPAVGPSGSSGGCGGSSGGGGGPSSTAQQEDVEDTISALLHLGCIARHSDGDADAYLLAVPGAGKVVKSILGGRKEVLTWLSKRQHLEGPEEQICKLRLRTSCLPPLFHVRDLVGRGAVRRLETTSGPVVRLPGGKQGGKGAAGGRKAPG